MGMVNNPESGASKSDNVRNKEQDGLSNAKDREYFTQKRIKYKPGHGISRYDNALGNLIPIRPKTMEKEIMPLDKIGLFSYIYETWLTKYLWKAHKKGIFPDDIPMLSPYDTCSYNSQRLGIIWEEEMKRRGSDSASFGLVVWRFVRTRIFIACTLLTLTLIFGLISPMILMRKILEHVQSTEGSFWDGMKWVVILTVSEFLRTALFTWMHVTNYRTAIRLRSACLALLYKRIVNLNGIGGKSTAEFLTMFSVDGQRIFDMIIFGPMIISGPIIIICSIAYILWLLNPIALTGMIVFVLFYPVQFVMSRIISYYRRKCVKATDTRLRNMNEILNCIKVIKMQALEEYFTQKMFVSRKLEKKWLHRIAYFNSLSNSLVPAIPVLSTIVTFLAYLSTGSNLTAAQAFSVSACFGNLMKQSLSAIRDGTLVFNDVRIAFERFKVFPLIALFSTQIRTCCMYVQAAITNIFEATISFDRIKKVLLMEETTCQISKPIVRFQAVAILNGRFECENVENRVTEQKNNIHIDKRKFVHDINGDKCEEVALNVRSEHEGKRIELLVDITFEASKGKLIGICGQVGSGKSSLLLAALGQLKMTSGQMMRDGTCAYVSQQAWIINATIKENILFGENFDNSRYNRALFMCCLHEDLAALPAGDETEIGERGVNLSGGQKQRIALARSFYANRDIYFLDDPLSAVDVYVATHVFENLILEELHNKTVLFATHQIQYLTRCDDIYVMRNGRIVEHGTHDDLMRYDREYAFIVKSIAIKAENSGDDSHFNSTIPLNENDTSEVSHISATNIKNASYPNSEEKKLPKNIADGKLIVENDIKRGGIKRETYQTYAKAAGGYLIVLAAFVIFVINVGSTAFSTWWLAFWIKAGSGNTTVTIGNETVISDNINYNPNFNYYYTVYASCLGFILLTSFMRGAAVTCTTIRASTRLHNDVFKKIIFSPIKFFDTTLSGVILNIFSADMDEIDTRLPISLESITQNILVFSFAVLFICIVLVWYIIPVIFLGSLFFFIGVIFRTGMRDLKRWESSLRSPIFSFVSTTIQGLNTIHAFNKENLFIKRFEDTFDRHSSCYFFCNLASRWLAVRFDSLTVVSTFIIAFIVICLRGQVAPALAGLAMAYGAQISGVFQYMIRVLSEVEVRFVSVERISHYLKTLEDENIDIKAAIEPSESWPNHGEIVYKNLNLKYGTASSHALKDISFVIKGGEKIGIVGRTGSGKTSLVVTLFRLFEPDSGVITIDGIDTCQINRYTLRRRLTIIPQDPILFDGTIRNFIDHEKKYTDDAIWEALEKTRMKDRVSSTVAQLQHQIEDGKQFSMGEKQLLCLTKALLHRNKILVLDEATSSMDPETETTVQQIIQTAFEDCTILVIAHRLQNVLNCDRILVMSNGEVVEFDTAKTLLSNPDSYFYKMIMAAEETAKNL